MPLDIRPDHLRIVEEILEKHLPDREVWAFGSRVNGTAKETSDLDLAVIGETSLDFKTLAALRDAFSESNIPYKVDVVDWATISETFREIIRKDKVVIKRRKSSTFPNSWDKVRFGDILIGLARNGVYKSKEFHGSGVKIVNMGELFANPRLRTSTPMKRLNLSSEELQKTQLEKGDLLFARRSLVAEGAGKCSLVIETPEPATFESSIIRVRPAQTRVDSTFLYYLFGSPVGVYLLGTIRRQVAVSGITGSDLIGLTIPLPPLPEQRAIAHILGTLDDKIELNRRMNETLEAMARAIFKSWFVDFDPVRAKMEGRPTGLPKEIENLFPDSFEDSELGEIPRGWDIVPIEELATIVGGSTPSTKDLSYWNGAHYWATPKDLSALTTPVLLETERKITDKGVSQITSGQLPAGTLLLSSRAPIGYLAITEVPISINQGFIGLLPRGGISNIFLLYWAKNSNEEIMSRANGSTFLEISKRNFRTIPIARPPKNLMAFFDSINRPMFKRIVSNEKEVRGLAEIRDSLLPKLISGEIRTVLPENLEKGSETLVFGKSL